MAKEKAFVQISIIRERSILFDFGHFAILEEYYEKNQYYNLIALWANKYNKFLKDVDALINEHPQSVEINPEIFRQIESLCRTWSPKKARKWEYENFWELLDEAFPRYKRRRIR